MNKNTLARDKELEKDISEMETALKYYKNGRWGNWGINDTVSTFHFAFHKHYGDGSAYREDLPRWLNKPLMEVVERELERCKHELETLGDDPAETTTDDPEAGQDTFDPAMTAMAASLELDKPRKTSWKDGAIRTLDRMISWMLYSLAFCFLLGVAGLDLSTRESVAYSLMLGLVVGSINNIERVMMELFRRED